MEPPFAWRLTMTPPTDPEAEPAPTLLDAAPLGFKVWWATHGGHRPLDGSPLGRPTLADEPT